MTLRSANRVIVAYRNGLFIVAASDRLRNFHHAQDAHDWITLHVPDGVEVEWQVNPNPKALSAPIIATVTLRNGRYEIGTLLGKPIRSFSHAQDAQDWIESLFTAGPVAIQWNVVPPQKDLTQSP